MSEIKDKTKQTKCGRVIEPNTNRVVIPDSLQIEGSSLKHGGVIWVHCKRCDGVRHCTCDFIHQVLTVCQDSQELERRRQDFGLAEIHS
jgi:hypothetical protein